MSNFERLKALPHDGSGAALSRARAGATAIGVTWAVIPVPKGDALIGSDGELSGALEALGYAQPISDAQREGAEDEEKPRDEGSE